MEFHQGTTLLGTVTASPYSYTWSNVAMGSYSLTAVATDNYGVQTTSAAVSVTVNSGVAQAYYIHTDQLDTPRVITDTNGNVVWQWDSSDPFGANMANENPGGAGTFNFNLRFPGQYYDRETNLHYNVNRDYDPAIGRYVQSDPIGLRGGVNTYTYVGGNPLSWDDPLGLCKVEVRYAKLNKWDLADLFGYPDLYHAYIVTTDPNGYQYYYRGGPTPSIDSKTGPTWGPIYVRTGKYEAGTKDWDPGKPPSDVVIDDGKPCTCENAKLDEAAKDINIGKVLYSPYGPNSNSVVNYGLQSLGIQGYSPSVLAPGWPQSLGGR